LGTVFNTGLIKTKPVGKRDLILTLPAAFVPAIVGRDIGIVKTSQQLKKRLQLDVWQPCFRRRPGTL